jgi:hypothetical protein
MGAAKYPICAAFVPPLTASVDAVGEGAVWSLLVFVALPQETTKKASPSLQYVFMSSTRQA